MKYTHISNHLKSSLSEEEEYVKHQIDPLITLSFVVTTLI